MQSTCTNRLTTQLPWLLLLLCFLGFLSSLKLSISFFKWVFTRFLRLPKNLIKNYGSWALITGAAVGIGKAFAHQLGQKGLNLILVSKNSTKLKTISSEIQAQFPTTQIKVVAFDFSTKIDSTSIGLQPIEEQIKGVEVGVLINNVGVTYPAARFFHEVDEKVWMNIVKVNLEGTTWVIRAVLQGMLERKRGAIVNISSGAFIVVPSHPICDL